MMIAANKPPTFGLETPIDGGYGSCGYGYGCGPAPHQKRKLNNPIDEVQELRDTKKRMKIQNEKMKLVCGSCYCPKDNPKKPLGEDAHFISHFAQTIGVADGVGGWARKGIDAGEYARGIMNHAKETATHMAAIGAHPVDARKELASTIAAVALFNSEDEDNVTPFQMAAEKAGVEHVGGKIDDITVVVAIVVASRT
ncbi:hypothetical protein GBA52_013645 [Prunus armeniaca]|nr:hypothetical protein GBA52_013645 [Prunus armeniaca]